jgi:hypothetical protein
MHLIAGAAFDLLVIGMIITAVIGPFYLYKLYKEKQL